MDHRITPGFILFALTAGVRPLGPQVAQQISTAGKPTSLVIKNIRVFDGANDQLKPENILVSARVYVPKRLTPEFGRFSTAIWLIKRLSSSLAMRAPG